MLLLHAVLRCAALRDIYNFPRVGGGEGRFNDIYCTCAHVHIFMTR